MGDARCSCGAVTLSLPEEPSKLVVACHCIDCQRRTGAPFGVGAYYPAEVVTISGTSKEFTHAAASGGKIHNYFCPQCGSTVYWKLSNLPALIAVAVGAMAEPKYPAPVISVFEQSKHDWVQIDGAVEHFPAKQPPKKFKLRHYPALRRLAAHAMVELRSPHDESHDQGPADVADARSDDRRSLGAVATFVPRYCGTTAHVLRPFRQGRRPVLECTLLA